MDCGCSLETPRCGGSSVCPRYVLWAKILTISFPYFQFVMLKKSMYSIFTLYTVDATEYVTAQIHATFHEGRGKWRAVS